MPPTTHILLKLDTAATIKGKLGKLVAFKFSRNEFAKWKPFPNGQTGGRPLSLFVEQIVRSLFPPIMCRVYSAIAQR